MVRKLAASSPEVSVDTKDQADPSDRVVLDVREASALYLLAKLKHVPEGMASDVKARLRENAKALRAALTHPFAREVARVLERPSATASEAAHRYASDLIESAAPSAGHA